MAFKMKGFSGFKNKSDQREILKKFTKSTKDKSKTYSDAGEPGLLRPKKNDKKESLEDFLSKKATEEETKMSTAGFSPGSAAGFPKKQYDSGWDAKAKAQWKTDYRKRNNHKGPIDRKLYPWVNM